MTTRMLSVMPRWLRFPTALAMLLAGASTCTKKGVSLSVDLRTDYAAGAELAVVRTEIVPGSGDPRSSETPIIAGDPRYFEGGRIGDFDDLATGTTLVRVRAFAPNGSQLVERLSRIDLSADYAMTVVISRSCEAKVCPDGETCDRGRCVKLECTPKTPEACPPPPVPECTSDSGCTPTVPCARARCFDGACSSTPDDGNCDASQRCDPGKGCVTRCAPGSTFCGGGCVDTSSDGNHCGGCNKPCGAGSACSGGTCSTVCASGLTTCGASCVNLAVDRNNCGACGRACPSDATCSGSMCRCPSGRTLCGNVCADLQFDENNCNTCGKVCPGGFKCCGGQCFDVGSNETHCGFCNTSCNTAGNERCCAGSCTNVNISEKNCGMCFNTCGMANPKCCKGSCSKSCP